MRIQLERLPHQKKSLENIIEHFPGIEDENLEHMYANPLIKNRYANEINIDVKMETGTGKTYVYTRLMYELHKLYGLYKFIVVVPSPAIKEGTSNFINSVYAKQHFSQFYENVNIDLKVINAGDFKTKSGRRNFPAHLMSFAEGTRLNKNTIHVLLINAGMLNSINMKRSDYDQTLIGGITSPVEAIRKTNPIIIIDEPHRFPRNKTLYKAVEDLKPQMIFRFGATFPIITSGRGKNKIEKADYYRNYPQYELNAIDSFNQGLVKGIDIYYPNLSEDQAKNRYKISKVTNKELVLKQGSRNWTLTIGDNLADVDNAFEGNISYAGARQLSNELELREEMELVPGTFKSSYQELIIKDALEKHFEIEQENFMRRNLYEMNDPKIKTLSLFFIDSIKSYRDTDGWLKLTFERLLKEKINQLISVYEQKNKPREIEYLDYLRETLKSLNLGKQQNVHAGYFGEDRGSGDEAIQAEVSDILKNKNKMLSFKNDIGEWETRRFLFSKWTLREGWDNPNVFVIAKLRTSGSENSKIQEVGRGLRLPVDENGRRITQEEWPSRLAFLIGYDERDFANKLISEINKEARVKINEHMLSEEMIEIILRERKKEDKDFNKDALLSELDELNIINRSNEFKSSVEIDGETKSGLEWILELYPELLAERLQRDRIIEPEKENISIKVKLKKENWEKVKEIWKEFSKRYMLEFERDPDRIKRIAEKTVGNVTLYEKDMLNRTKLSMQLGQGTSAPEFVEQIQEYESTYSKGLSYGKFIQEITLNTSLPVKYIHQNILKILKDDLKGDLRYLSESTINNIRREFKKIFDEEFLQSYEYHGLNFMARTSIYNPTTDSFVDDVNANLLGVNIDNTSVSDDRHMYEVPPIRYDSKQPERELLRYGYPKKVTVFGKLPKGSIQVPKYTGGTTTPDFIYVIEQQEGSSVYLLVETKSEDMRGEELKTVEIQKEFFEILKAQSVSYKMATNAQEVYSKIREISEE